MSKKEYLLVKVAVDPVIFTLQNGRIKVLLQPREKEPYQGMKELPGGLLLPPETAEETLKRKLRELLGHENLFFTQFYTFTAPDRDPRGRTISIGFVALVGEEKIKEWKGWMDMEQINDAAFDHLKIIGAARNYLKENLTPSIVKHFMPVLFPLNKLQEVYELLEGKKYDNRNFRKKMLSSGIVEETKQMEKEVSHRPAKLFRFA